MPVEFRSVVYREPGRVLELDFSIQDGVWAAVLGLRGSGRRTLLRLTSGCCKPDLGEIRTGGQVALAAVEAPLPDEREILRQIDEMLSLQYEVFLIGPALGLLDEERRQLLAGELHRRQRQGAIILMAINDLCFAEQHCDEALLLHAGKLAARGDARGVIAEYRKQVFGRLRVGTAPAAVTPAARHGDGRAVVRSIRINGSGGAETAMLGSGEQATILVSLRFNGDVDDPVCGILIRSRVGITVYGTNTEQENLHFGPCRDGDEVEIAYQFPCNLCPGEYTVTVASHDPDGTAHEWLEEAVLFTVSDTRYTTGVANLRAAVTVRRLDVSTNG